MIRSSCFVNPNNRLYLILLLPLFIDMFIGISNMWDINFPFGKLYRGFLYLLGFISVLRYNIKGYFISFLLIFLIFFVGWFLFNENFSFFREISFVFKATYLFAILQLIRRVDLRVEKKEEVIYFILKRYSQIVAGLIIFSFITGIGLDTYGKWVFGTSSFFVAQNDIGLSHLLVFTFLLFNKELFNISWLWLFLIFLSLIFLGTSTGMFGALAVVILYVFFKLILSNLISVKNFIFRFLAIIILFVLFCLSSIILYNYIKNSDYYSKKYEKILTEGFRSRLKNAGDIYFSERGITKNIFGEGFSSYTTNLGNSASEIKLAKGGVYKDWILVETDIYDFYGSFGIFLSLIFFSYYIYCLMIAVLNYYNKRNIYNFSLLLVFSMAIFHGIMAGHVFYSPTVLGILVIIVFLIQFEYYKKI